MKNEHCVVVVVGGGDVLLVSDEELGAYTRYWAEKDGDGLWICTA